MTIIKQGSKFRVVSGEGKNLGEAKTKTGAAKRLGQIEWFKTHKKCIVDPDLVKGGGEQQYVPVVFKVDKPKDKEAQKLDFPSTTKQMDLKDVKQPEFPSTPFTGEAYSQSFHNPRPSNSVKDETHVTIEGGKGTEYSPGSFRGEHGPDVQHKGSDYVPKKTRKSIMIAGKKVIIMKGSEGSDNSYLRDYPIDRGESGREFNADNESQARKDIFRDKQMKEKVRAYDEAKKIHSYKPGNGPYDLAQGDSAYLGRSKDGDINKGAYKKLGAALLDPKSKINKKLKAEENRTSSDPTTRMLRNDGLLKPAGAKKSMGKFFDDKDSMKILSDKEIKAKHKADKEIESPKPVTKKLREIKIVDKSKGIMRLVLQYTQNQPLAAGFKPLLAHLVKDEDEDDGVDPRSSKKAMTTSQIAEKIGQPKQVRPASASRIRLMERASKEKTEDSSEDSSGPHPDFGPTGGYKGDTSKLGKTKKSLAGPFRHSDISSRPENSEYGKELLERARLRKEQEQEKPEDKTAEVEKGAFKDKWIKQQEASGKDPSAVPGEKKGWQKVPMSKEDEAKIHADRKNKKDPYSADKSNRPNPIDGGIGDKLDYKDVDQNELSDGINVEQEHVKNSDDDEDKKKVKAADIAMDHLEEDDHYYTHLSEMERKAKAEDKADTQKKKLLKIDTATKSFVFKALRRNERTPSSDPYKEYQYTEKVKRASEPPKSFKKEKKWDDARRAKALEKKAGTND